jgi:hypothetical protein
MDILQTLIKLRDDIKEWVTNNLVALDNKIESKTITIDNELKTDSTNPVQNKIIKAKTDELANAISALDNIIETIQNNIDNITDDGSGELNIADPNGNVIFKIDANGAHTTKLKLSSGDIDTQLDAIKDEIARVANEAFSGDYNDLTNKPNIKDDESGEYVITDNDGNIIFKVDNNGAHTIEINLDGIKVKETLETLSEDIDNINKVAIPGVVADLAAHKADKNNPHEVAFKQLKDSNIEDDESKELTIVDVNGNIIMNVDSNGIATTDVILNRVKDPFVNPEEGFKTISLKNHATNTDWHINPSEREAWNNAKGDIDTIKKDAPEGYQTLLKISETLKNHRENKDAFETTNEEGKTITNEVWHVTKAEKESWATREYVDELRDKIFGDEPPAALDTLYELAEAL